MPTPREVQRYAANLKGYAKNLERAARDAQNDRDALKDISAESKAENRAAFVADMQAIHDAKPTMAQAIAEVAAADADDVVEEEPPAE